MIINLFLYFSSSFAAQFWLFDIRDIKRENWKQQIARNGKLNIYLKNNFNLLVMNVPSKHFNFVSTLFQRRTRTLYQRCATLKIRRRILFHFQFRIKVNSTLIHNVETTLIRRWNVGWVTQLNFPYSQNLHVWHFINVNHKRSLLFVVVATLFNWSKTKFFTDYNHKIKLKT